MEVHQGAFGFGRLQHLTGSFQKRWMGAGVAHPPTYVRLDDAEGDSHVASFYVLSGQG